jgi:hypothetical protein
MFISRLLTSWTSSHNGRSIPFFLYCSPRAFALSYTIAGTFIWRDSRAIA